MTYAFYIQLHLKSLKELNEYPRSNRIKIRDIFKEKIKNGIMDIYTGQTDDMYKSVANSATRQK